MLQHWVSLLLALAKWAFLHAKVKHPSRVDKGKGFIVLPLVFVLLTSLVFYITFAPVISPYLGLAQLLFSQVEQATPTDRFTGLAENLAKSGVLQLSDYPVEGDLIGQIDIEDTALSAPVYYGDGNSELNKGAGVYMGAWIPGEGRTVMIAGHAGTFFRKLEGIQPGMQIRFATYYGEYMYEVTEAKVLEAVDESAYDFSRTDENLILYTCYPFDALGYTPFRFFVYAKCVSGPNIERVG